MKIKQISPQNDNFLQRLELIALKPKMLYYCGKLPENDTGEQQNRKIRQNKTEWQDEGSQQNKQTGRLKLRKEPGGRLRPLTVAIVGSRKMTNYGEEHAYKAAYELAKRGAVIVSGLAMGCDAMAHRGALDAGGITVGILGTPIDRMYPVANRGLAVDILRKGGAILSECPPFREECFDEKGRKVTISSSEMQKWHQKIDSRTGAKAVFLKRNRLISGLADAVIVIEADEQSGSLNTAAHALEQGRVLFALPGDVSRRMSKGCNGLFGKGALAYTSFEDVLIELGVASERKQKKIGDTEEEKALMMALEAGLCDGEMMLEYLAKKGVEMDTAVFNQTITMLELKGVVRRLYGNRWAVI